MPNAILQDYRIFVNGENVSTAANGEQWLSLDYPGFNDEGLHETTGTLTLLPIQGFAANFFSPRKNATQWARGNAVFIDLQFGDGVWVRTFTGYILRRPATPTNQSPQLEIPIGCELTYRNRVAPAGDEARVTLGTSTARTTIIGNIWSGIGGLGAWSGTINRYPLRYNLPKHTGSYVQQMGEIALTGLSGLYCDRNGNLQASEFSLGPGSYLVERTDDDSFLSPRDGSEPVAQEVEVNLVGRSVEDTQLTRTIGPLIDTGVLIRRIGYGISPTETIITGIKKKTTITEIWAFDRKSRTVVTLVETPFFAAGSGDNYELVVRSLSTVTETYSQAIDGKILTRETIVDSDRKFLRLFFFPNITFNGSVVPTGDPVRNDRVVETWTYDGEVPLTYTREDYDVAIRTGGTSANIEEFLQERQVETYTDLGGDEWLKVVEMENWRFRSSDTISSGIESQVFQGAEYAPRQPSRHAPIASTDEQTFTGVATYNVVGATDEPALYEYGYGVSNAQAEALADIHGGILVGRDFAWTVSHELTRAWVEGWTPASKVKLTLPDNDIIVALVDGVNVACSDGEAIVSYGAAELGVIGTSGANIIPPYTTGVFRAEAVADAFGITSVTAGIPTDGGVNGAEAAADAFGVAGEYEAGVEGAIAIAEAFGSAPDTVGDPTPQPVLAVNRGGTGAFTAEQARQNLGLGAINTDDITGTVVAPVLKQTGAAAGNYTNPDLTIDSKGRVTAISSGTGGEALPLTTKGDLVTHNGTNPVRLPVGQNGYIVYADSTQPSGIRWGEAPSGGGSVLSITQATASRLLALADAGAAVQADSNSNIVLTVPNDTNVDFPIGSRILISRIGTGAVELAAESGVQLNSPNSFRRISGQHQWAQLYKKAANEWQLFGELADVDDASNFIARLTGTYSQAELDAITDFFTGTKQDNTFDKIEGAYIKCLDNQIDALLNIKGLSFTATNNGMSFTAREGFTGNGSNSYIDTGFVPASSSVYVQNSASLFIYIRNNIAEAAYDMSAQDTSGGTKRNYIAARWSDNTHYALVNATGSNYTNSSSTDSRGLWVTSRTSSNLVTTYRNAVNQDTNTALSISQATTNLIIGGLNTNGVIDSHSTKQYAFSGWGSGFSDAEVAALNSRVVALLTAFGANV